MCRPYRACHQDDTIPYLVPGDFRTVRQSLFYLAAAATNSTYLSALRNESAIKSQTGSHGTAQAIGF